MIGIVDYGMGNLRSVYNALEMLGATPQICPHPDELKKADRLILPGVGAFRDCIAHLTEKGFVEVLNELVLQQGKPILGICLGMQAMAQRSFEDGEYVGLGWFEGDVVRIKPNDPNYHVPHVGWNNLDYRPTMPLFSGLPASPDFYFVHSYHMQCRQTDDVIATCEHGCTVTAAVWKNNIVATQFHPEKSQDYGLKLLENFLSWSP